MSSFISKTSSYKMQGLLARIDSLLHFLVKCVFSLPLTFLAIPLYTFTILLFFVCRILVVQVARCAGNPNLRRPLDLGSAAVSHFESPFKVTPTWVIVATAVLEGVPEMERIREFLSERLLGTKDEEGKPCYPEILQTVEYFMGYPFWKRIPGMTGKMALDKYVALHKRLGGWDANSILDFVKTFAVKQFKEDCPLWEIAILENYTVSGSSEPYFAMVLRAQHTLTDGMSFLSLLQGLGGHSSSQNTDKIRMTLPPSYRVYQALSPIYRGGYDILSSALNWEVAANWNSLWQKSILTQHELQPDRLPEEFSAAHSFSLDTPCSTLTSIKKVSKAWGVSGTTVILTAILRSVKNELCTEQTVLPTYVNMVITLSSPLHNQKLSNTGYVVNILVPLYLFNPITQAKEVDKEWQSVKQSSLPCVMERVTRFGGIIPHFIMEPVLKNWWSTRPEHLFLSTLIGPKESSTICGYRTKEISYLLPPGDGRKYPLFQLISAVDKMYFSLAADRSVIQDDAIAHRMVMGFHDEIENFQNF